METQRIAQEYQRPKARSQRLEQRGTIAPRQLYQKNHRPDRKGEEVLKGLVAGVVGGLVASWTMNQFQAAMSKLTKPPPPKKPDMSGNHPEEEQEPATTKIASAISERLFHRKLTKSEKETAGEAVHYGFGAVMGGLYGAVAEVAPGSTRGAGLVFGTVLWLVADEAAVPAFGFSKSPAKYPLSTHLKALASHLVYGFTTEAVRRGIRRGRGTPSLNS
ncbi:MAG: hypothetical protein JWR26_1189 [Pedosphaera sp.]|nr:hypothetical protein [Pedosphaera sp.]